MLEPVDVNPIKTQITKLIEALNKDLLACDFKWSLFVSAAMSYRYDSQLKPFPPKYLIEDKIDIDALGNTIAKTPPFPTILFEMKHQPDSLSTDVVELLHWVIIGQNSPPLRTVEKKDFESILANAPCTKQSNLPNHIFEVCPAADSKMELKFKKEGENFTTQFGYHGSKLDSFHSILQHGLNQHMCKNALFGEGIYLASELTVSMIFSPFRAGWGGSACGSILSCIAVCEYVENPKHFGTVLSKNKKTKISEKYIVITNNDIVRIRYLLVYKSTSIIESNLKTTAIAWLQKYKFTIGVCCYTLILAWIGFSKSTFGNYLYFLINKKMSNIISFTKEIIFGYV